MRSNFVFVAAALAVATVPAPLHAQTGIPNLDKGMNILKRLEQQAGPAPARKPAAEPAPAQTPAEAAPTAPGSGAKLDLDSDPVQPNKEQSPQSGRTQAAPSVVDVKLGMSPKEAADALAKRYPKAVHKTVRVRWESPVKADFVGGLMAIEAKEVKDRRISHGEYVLVTLAGPPNQPAVIAIKRTLVFAQGQESNRHEWVKSLEGKYGRATVRNGRGGAATDTDDVLSLTWYFDKTRPGDPKASNGPLSSRCVNLIDWSRRVGTKFESQFDDKLVARLADGDLGNTFAQWMTDASANEERLGFCGRVLEVNFEVKRAGMGDHGSAFISGVHMTLTDHDGAAAAARKTNAVIADASKARAAQKVEQSKQHKPTL